MAVLQQSVLDGRVYRIFWGSRFAPVLHLNLSGVHVSRPNVHVPGTGYYQTLVNSCRLARNTQIWKNFLHNPVFLKYCEQVVCKWSRFFCKKLFENIGQTLLFTANDICLNNFISRRLLPAMPLKLLWTDECYLPFPAPNIFKILLCSLLHCYKQQ